MFKRFLLTVLICKLSLLAFPQVITDTATLRARINSQIVPNATQSITAQKLNWILTGYLNTMPYLWQDSVWRVPGTDSFFWRKNFTTFKIKDSIGATTVDGLSDFTVTNPSPGSTAFYNGSGWVNRNPPWKQQGTISLTGVTEFWDVSDSYGLGSFSNDATKIWAIRVKDTFSLTREIHSANSAGWYNGVRDMFVESPNLLSTTRNQIIAVLLGNADVIANDATQLHRNKINGLAKTLLANVFLESATPMSDASVTKVGFSNSSVTCETKAENIGGTVQVATTSGSTLTFDVPIGAGEGIVIGTFSSIPGTVIGDFQIDLSIGNGFGSDRYVDFNGSERFAGVGDFPPATEPGLTHYPSVIIIRGLTAGTITVTITTNSNTATYLDYFGVLEAPADCKPVIVGAVPHLDDDINPNFGVGMIPRHNDYIDVINTSIRDAVYEKFSDFPISFVNTNDYFNSPIHLLHPDNLHPNATSETLGKGDAAIAQAFIDGIRIKTFATISNRNSKPEVKVPLTFDHIRDTWGIDTTSSAGVATQSDIAVFLTTESKFGVTGQDNSTAENRAVNFHNTNTLNLDSVNVFQVSRGSIARILMNSSSTALFSPNGNNSIQTSDVVAKMSINNDANLFLVNVDSSRTEKRISYTGNIHPTFTAYSLVTKKYVDSLIAIAGGTPTLEQVTVAGNTSSNTIIVEGTGVQLVLRRLDLTSSPEVLLGVQSGSGTVEVTDTFNVSTKYQVNRIVNSSNNILAIPNGTGLDTFALLADVRSGPVVPLKQFFTTQGNVSTTETDLFTYTMPANTMTTDGDNLEIEFAGEYLSAGATIKFSTWFDGNQTQADQFNIVSDWRVYIKVIRVSETSYRMTIQEGSTQFGTTVNNNIDVATDFTNAIIIKLTGIGTATDQVKGYLGAIKLIKASN